MIIDETVKFMDSINFIFQNCSPKEVCLGIVEQMDTNLKSGAFLTLLAPLQKGKTWIILSVATIFEDWHRHTVQHCLI